VAWRRRVLERQAEWQQRRRILAEGSIWYEEYGRRRSGRDVAKAWLEGRICCSSPACLAIFSRAARRKGEGAAAAATYEPALEAAKALISQSVERGMGSTWLSFRRNETACSALAAKASSRRERGGGSADGGRQKIVLFCGILLTPVRNSSARALLRRLRCRGSCLTLLPLSGTARLELSQKACWRMVKPAGRVVIWWRGVARWW